MQNRDMNLNMIRGLSVLSTMSMILFVLNEFIEREYALDRYEIYLDVILTMATAYFIDNVIFRVDVLNQINPENPPPNTPHATANEVATTKTKENNALELFESKLTCLEAAQITFPSWMICPILFGVMRDPCVAVTDHDEDGNSYDKSALPFFQKNNSNALICPKSARVVKKFSKNTNLKAAIYDWIDSEYQKIMNSKKQIANPYASLLQINSQFKRASQKNSQEKKLFLSQHRLNNF